MSLVCWYPLNGDTLDYSGNSNHATNNGATIDDNGKIGKCYIFDGADDYILISSKLSQTYSVFFNVLENQVEYSAVLSTYSYSGTRSGFRLRPKGTTLELLFGNRGSNSIYSVCNIDIGTWYHAVIIFDSSYKNVRVFIDGELKLEVELNDLVFIKPISDIVTLGRGAIDSSTGGYLNCKINDVRIYDHTLSEKEIKELSKAKILHCTFDDFQEPTENLLPEGVREKTGTREYLMYTNLSPIFDTHGVGTYTFSFDIKTPVPGSISVYCNDRTANTIKYNYSSMVIYVTEDYQRFTMTRDITLANADATHTSLAFYGTYDSGRIPTVRNVQIEKKDHATPFTPDTREGVVRDISGYRNHAVLDLTTSPQWVNESKIGGGAYKFKTGNSIKAKILLEPKIEEEYSYGQLLGSSLLGI